MCGIFGVVFKDPRARADAPRVTAARDSLTHRGPDEAGLWIEPGVALAHRRRNVLDLRHGQQPMRTDGCRFALTYNGEVYNFRDLQRSYAERGLRFDTQCDTEVVLKAIALDGPGALDGFNGMFAIAHYDAQRRTLLLARDRLGQKPVYWYADDSQLVFASELKAVLEYLQQRFAVDATALDQFFARGYVLSPRTIFEGIRKLPAGSMLTLDAQAWRIDERAWWDVQPVDVPTDAEAVIDGLDELLGDAVRMRLVSDVPLGCLLSGGIDSSIITGMAAKARREPINAFSIGFDNEALNELPWAEMVAERHGCAWHHRYDQADEFLAALATTPGYFDEPFGNPTMFSMRRVARMARDTLTVVLSGQGGDELTAGYPGRYNWVTQAGDEPGARPIEDVISHLNHSSFLPYPQARAKLYSPAMVDAVCAAATPMTDLGAFWDRHRSLDRLNNVLYVDVKTNLPDYLVCIEERMTMSVALEARNPLLDHRVVNYCLSIPAAMKVREGQNKWVLRELAKRYMPTAALERPKRGFTPPLAQWLGDHRDAVRAIYRDADEATHGLYAPMWRDYLHGGAFNPAWSQAEFYSLMLAIWVSRYGQTVSHWPGEALTTSTPRKRSGDNPWQNVYRFQEGGPRGAGQWFARAMGNFSADARVLVVGDPHGWYTYLAESGGLRPTRMREDDSLSDDAVAHRAGRGLRERSIVEGELKDGHFDGLVLIGQRAVEALLSDATHGDALAPGGSVVMFIPFAVRDQASVERLLGDVARQCGVDGYQAAGVSSTEAVLIARSTLGAAQRAAG